MKLMSIIFAALVLLALLMQVMEANSAPEMPTTVVEAGQDFSPGVFLNQPRGK